LEVAWDVEELPLDEELVVLVEHVKQVLCDHLQDGLLDPVDAVV